MPTRAQARRNLLSIGTDHIRHAIYTEIRDKGPVAKSALGLNLPVSKPTRYSMIASLIAEGLVLECQSDRVANGSRSAMVDIVPDLFHSIGIDINVEGLEFILLDLKHHEKDSLFLPNGMDPLGDVCTDSRQVVLERMREGVTQLLHRNDHAASDILACGISDFGMVDAPHGLSLFTPHIPGWVDVPLRSIIQRYLPVPVFLGRDANLTAIGEIEVLGIRDFDDLLCVTLRRGIGLGVFINGQLYTGHNGNAGELAHVVVPGIERTCVCGRQGCIDLSLGYAAIMELVRHTQTRLGSHRAAHAADVPPGNTLREVFDAFESGDKEISEALGTYIRALALHVENLVGIFDPALVVLSGWFVQAGDRFLEQLRNSFWRGPSTRIRRPIDIRKGVLGNKAAAWGAAFAGQDLALQAPALEATDKATSIIGLRH